jgi:hypothetical protein
MAIQISESGAVKSLVYRIGSIEDYSSSGKLKLADFSSIEMGRNRKISGP